jgi:group I intron endonuclease
MIVYKITNKIDGKAYIGQTIETINRRWKRHIAVSNKNGNSYFHKAIRKYGFDNFALETLYECSSYEILGIMETFKIMVHKTHISEGGYNLTWGGEGSYGRKRSKETNLKLSGKNHPMYGRDPWNKGKKGVQIPWNKGKKGLQVGWNKGKSLDNETKLKISKKQMGRKPSEETKQKMSESRIRYCQQKQLLTEGEDRKSVV